MADVWANSMTYVIPEPRITLQGAATWWIHCHDSRATCHIAGCKNSIRHIENSFSPYFILFLFLMQCWLWRAAAFVSSPIHLFTSDKGGGTCFCPCSFICLSVSKITQKYVWIWMKCCVSTDVGTWTNWLTFEPDPDCSPDAGTGLLYPISYKRCNV